MKRRVLLLHPPYTRDCNRGYYCSATTKSAYLFPPLDLLFISGTVRDAGHEVSFIDCIADRIDAPHAIERIKALRPDCIVALCGIVSWDADRTFLRSLKERHGMPIVVSGDVFLGSPEKIMGEEDWIDGILFDFTNRDIVNYLQGNEQAIVNMMFKKGEAICNRRGREVTPGATFELPVPMHELFLGKRYRHPFTRSKPLTSVLTSFGCPYHCYFCVADSIPFKYCRAGDVVKELDYVKKLGIPEILFFDFTFGVPREERKKLCGMMVEREYGFNWSCYSRVDVVDDEMLYLFKASGCHTIMFGVESGDDEILKKYCKGITREKIRETFGRCRREGIDTVGTFILGGFFDTMESSRKTIRFARELKCGFASFNIAVPRPQTQFRAEAIRSGMIGDGDLNMDHSGSRIIWSFGHLSSRQLSRLRRAAVVQFYLRPRYLFHRLAKIKSWHQVRELFSNGFDLVRRTLWASCLIFIYSIERML